HTTVGDNPLRLYTAILKALGRSDIVITTGGLGPTVDDVTLEAVSRALDEKLIFVPQVYKLIEERFKKRHIKMPADNKRQAYIPNGAQWFKNIHGTAPGFAIKKNNKILIALPGPPMEMNPMFENCVIPYLKKLTYEKSCVIRTRTIRTTGLAESAINPKVKDILRLSGNTTVGIYAKPGEVDLKITAKAKNEKQAHRLISSIERKIKQRLEALIFGYDDDTLESAVSKLLIKNKKTIAIAESCTGGLLSSRLTDTAGSSNYLILSVVAYANKAKINILGVPEQALKKYGAVSAQTAELMAKNVRLLANADIGISITGIAGPGGATKKKPVGLVYIAISDKNKTACKECYFIGERELIKHLSTQTALAMLRRYL
ncbi:MAG: competence/damage-inducible protein A, partial [Candidatus Omnitrophica bacterium]|nr:competence/damage-inducible protein A [Candidatus Omnitrophota bacterium]